MLDGLLRKEFFDLVYLEALQRRLDKAVEEEGRVHEQRKAHHLQPLEGLPSEPKGDHPDEQSPASVNGRAGRGADGSRYGEAEEVETSWWGLTGLRLPRVLEQITHPILIIIKTPERKISRSVVSCLQPSTMSK